MLIMTIRREHHTPVDCEIEWHDVVFECPEIEKLLATESHDGESTWYGFVDNVSQYKAPIFAASISKT
jgi:hypothetical protein